MRSPALGVVQSVRSRARDANKSVVIDIPALKARLSDPREVAGLLGLRVRQTLRNGVNCACPVHNNKSGALRLRVVGGVLKMNCFGCGIYGDAIDLFVAMEGDYRRGIERAASLVGGSGLNGRYTTPAYKEPERCDPDVYHDLATRILDAGKLDGRPWTREVGEYLERHGLLELARADGWAALPSLGWLLQVAKEVCDGMSAGGIELVGNEAREASSVALDIAANERGDRVLPGRGGGYSGGKFNIGRDSELVRWSVPKELLVAAKLAKINKRGEFVAAWKGWNLVIPWRGPDGRINALQRRRTWVWTKRGPDDTEPAKYVLPWAPEWPYGSERLGYGLSSCIHKTGLSVDGESVCRTASNAKKARTPKELELGASGQIKRGDVSGHFTGHLAIVEGAVDTLAMRALHPSFAVLGIPGIGSWRASWASLVEGRGLRIALDRGKPGPDGIIPEDRAAARIALDCAGRAQETDRVLEWWLGRWRRGRALGCVLCGAGEAWLCGGCGRRRAPKGSDWGDLLAARAR